ncbi:MAG: MBL fold metallo-hydrolase [Dehalococcoidales bacterium]|nr:MBL fold metallo-hydrolase [Dehalococcoidales bacterium]
MKIKWLGHATFLITSETGTRLITDPYATNDRIKYGEIRESADIVTVSHGHFDHNNVAAVTGNPEVVDEAAPTEVKGIKIEGIPAYHDTRQGAERGSNIIFCLAIDGMRVCHLGDLGHSLGDKEIAEIGKVDILLIPVGGFFTIDAGTATEICRQLAPKVIIPMHYKNNRCELPISGVDDFLKGKQGINKLNTSEAEFSMAELPGATQIFVLQPAL